MSSFRRKMDGLERVWRDALDRLTAYAHEQGRGNVLIGVDDVEFYSWPQSWGDTTCGFGGIGGQAITVAQTSVFVDNQVTGAAVVYHAGGFAYLIKRPSAIFWEGVYSQNLPGKKDYSRRQFDHAE